MSVSVDNVSTSTMVVSPATLTLPTTVIAFLVAPKMGDIYNVPREYRTQPQGDKGAGFKEDKAPGKLEIPR